MPTWKPLPSAPAPAPPLAAAAWRCSLLHSGCRTAAKRSQPRASKMSTTTEARLSSFMEVPRWLRVHSTQCEPGRRRQGGACRAVSCRWPSRVTTQMAGSAHGAVRVPQSRRQRDVIYRRSKDADLCKPRCSVSTCDTCACVGAPPHPPPHSPVEQLVQKERLALAGAAAHRHHADGALQGSERVMGARAGRAIRVATA